MIPYSLSLEFSDPADNPYDGRSSFHLGRFDSFFMGATAMRVLARGLHVVDNPEDEAGLSDVHRQMMAADRPVGSHHGDPVVVTTYRSLVETGKCRMFLRDLETGLEVASLSPDMSVEPDFGAILENEKAEILPLEEEDPYTLHNVILNVQRGESDRAVDALNASGISPNVLASYDTGMTLAMFAARCDHFDLARTLLARGADINVVSAEGSFLAVIANRSDEEGKALALVREMIAKGADVHARGLEGNTALHAALSACTDNSWSIAEELLAAGADYEATDCLGRTPVLSLVFDIATQFHAIATKNIAEHHVKRQVENLWHSLDALDRITTSGRDFDYADFKGRNAADALVKMITAYKAATDYASTATKKSARPLTQAELAELKRAMDHYENSCRAHAPSAFITTSLSL